MAIIRFMLSLACTLLLPLAAAAQTVAPAAPAGACCGAAHQMPATDATSVDHSAHQAPDAGKPTMPGMKADSTDCCGAETSADTPKATVDCCAGVTAKDGKDAVPCAHCATKAAAKPADKVTDKATDAPAPACCDSAAKHGCCD